jgi:hypothetical protein
VPLSSQAEPDALRTVLTSLTLRLVGIAARLYGQQGAQRFLRGERGERYGLVLVPNLVGPLTLVCHTMSVGTRD